MCAVQIESQASSLQGEVLIPSSKSHTVRALFFALLAEGESTIRHPLDSGDTRAALLAAQGLGAEIAVGEAWTVQGRGGPPAPPANVLDVANSGTTLYIAAGAAALMDGCAVFTGDGQIRRRSAENLLAALRDLGAEAFSTRGNGCAPLVVGGPLRGGSTRIECPTSQYLTSLLMAAPLAPEETRIEVPLLHEAPYVRMTLDWLERLGVRVTAAADLSEFTVPGGQGYRSFDRQMPGDYSSATFFLCAAAVTEGEVLLRGLDPADPQGDKAVLDYLRAMGATVAEEADGLRVGGGALRGTELDLNATPDALPAMAVTACFAEGTTRLVNVPQARMKETDRIAVMAAELERLGGRVRELADGLEIEGAGLRGGKVCGHGDHRVVMSLCLAGLRCREPVRVTTAESVAVTFPDFPEKLAALGGRVRLIED
jgi:3-phosphoshikimate 1-carboxyvinyltransferase